MLALADPEIIVNKHIAASVGQIKKIMLTFPSLEAV